jgi:subfamily B ATP-binding cassette protein MsbA
LKLTATYRMRFILGILCGFVAGLTNPLLMVSVKLVVDTAFPVKGAPTLAEKMGNAAFSRQEILDVSILAEQLNQPTNPASAYLRSRLSLDTCLTLSNYSAFHTNAPDVQAALVREFQGIVVGESIYQKGRFADASLSPSTCTLLAEPAPAGSRLNRLLLTDTFPGAIMTPKPSAMPDFIKRAVWNLSQTLPNAQTHDAGKSKTGVFLLISFIPIAMLLRGLFTYLNTYLMNWVAIRVIADLRTRLFSHLLSLCAHFFSKKSTGELMSRFSDVSVLQGLISGAMVTIIREPITIVSLVILVVYQQPKLSLVALVVLPFTLIPFVVFTRKVRKDSRRMYAEFADMGKTMHEAFTGYRIVKAFNMEGRMTEEFRKSTRHGVSFFMRLLRATELPGPMIEFMGALGVTGLFAYLVSMPMEQRPTPGDLLQYAGSIFMMYSPVKNLLRLHSNIEQANSASRFMFDLLAAKSSVVEPANPKPLSAKNAAVTFENVTFAYEDGKPVVNDVSLTIPAGKMVAIVGASGSGKTTLTNLLLRFYDPQKGRILIGGNDIRDVTTHDLRSQIAVVTQEIILFNDTIGNNIGLGRPGATEDDIIAAAKHAYAHDFIVARPDGYKGPIGEKGGKLSGGQRQRIAIARAIVKNAPILILDEATSALDTERERLVQAALDDLMVGRTTICIAHRLSTIQQADTIVVMDEGRIVEHGTHKELLERNGAYRRLHDLQFRNV